MYISQIFSKARESSWRNSEEYLRGSTRIPSRKSKGDNFRQIMSNAMDSAIKR